MGKIRKTRIVCTIGPACSEPDVLEKLVQAGMDLARLNFSHGTHSGHLGSLREIRRLSKKFSQPVAVIQDLSGPKIRTGEIFSGELSLQPGAVVRLTGRKMKGGGDIIPVTYNSLARDVERGDRILLADGDIELRVERRDARDVFCKVVAGGMLGERKGVNIPARNLRLKPLTKRDHKDLNFGLSHGVDMVALSFVRSAKDIRSLKRIISRAGRDTPVIAKIEKPEAVERIDEIIEEADGLMVARGDLGVEIPLEDVPAVQKLLIRKANAAGKPVITATQMLRSMKDSKRPTRAEVADVANAVLDGTDALMLSEETAVGRYPVEAVRMMDRIARAAEGSGSESTGLRPPYPAQSGIADQISYSAYLMAHNMNARAIITPTRSGYTARLISRYRPAAEIIALSTSKDTVLRLALVRGVRAFQVPELKGSKDLMRDAVKAANKISRFRKGDILVVTAGLPLEKAGITNAIMIETV
jgi:pyruvate kinase